MKKINHKILSLPPYISTSWKNINALHMSKSEGSPSLTILLHNGSEIKIPNLEPALIEQIFAAHSAFLEREDQKKSGSEGAHKQGDTPLSFGFPFPIDKEGRGLDHFGSMVQHNPDHSNSPDLPLEAIHKITSMSKAIGIDLEKMNIPKAEPHCNCTYCQIARAIYSENTSVDQEVDQEAEEEQVSDADLKFRDWDIKQKSEKLYEVTNPIDKSENYRVFLGDPVGCTCGKKDCEHIRTVLSS